MSRWFRIAALTSVAFVLVVLGAALRPVVLPEKHTATPVLNAVEIGFAQDMTAHHQQALIMVQRLDRDVDPTVLRLAQQLSDTQRIEIGTLLGWLRLADTSPLSSHPMAWMHADVSQHHPTAGQPTSDAMPGMATTAELDALAAARGHDAGILFLQLMYRHHQGGLVMIRAVEELLTSGPVKETARSMFQSQSQEVGVISMLLTELGGPAPQ
ncbi:DUF305 domain-containing protein [Nocardia sp. NPDC049707]|uniref:DUF305 domain-containing protein n=1 Tax=Nocardia sp. NPDC049707 TaxID=3154735 RepID=UPI003418930C